MKGITRVTSSFSVRIILLFKQIFSDGENSISIMLYSISHIVTYTSCSTYYLTSSTNWTPHLMENSIREPKIFLLSIFLRMKLCTCSTTNFSSDCDRFVFLKSKIKENILHVIIGLTFEWYWPLHEYNTKMFSLNSQRFIFAIRSSFYFRFTCMYSNDHVDKYSRRKDIFPKVAIISSE